MRETNHFFDLGYGWLCKHCSAESAETKQNLRDVAAAVVAEDRKEQKEEVSQLALARWTDASRQALTCPRCGLEELISKM
ncbi:MAG TPA: hypothetical protein VJ124_06415 [Pyrinomonadaceae bacterium]|nr:hypothetical protein [Pyrinomonadaceae bacterium]